MENISEHITYDEATHSQTATYKGLDNTPPAAILAKMKITAEKVFEPLRAEVSRIRGVDSPITISSFYRAPLVNKAVGGAENSQHCKGEAIDLIVNYPDFNKKNLFLLVKEKFAFDQLIFEGGTPDNPAWVHVSYSDNNRHEILQMVIENGEPTYKVMP